MSYASFVEQLDTVINTAVGTTTPILIPECAAGDTLIALVRTSVTIYDLVGFTKISSFGTNVPFAVFRKDCVAPAAPGTADLTILSSGRLVASVLRYSNVDEVYCGTGSTIATPPAMNPGVGIKDFVMLAATSNSQAYLAGIDVTDAPPNYASLTSTKTSNTGGTVMYLGYARRSANTDIETPGAFTWSGSPSNLRSVLVMLSGLTGVTITETGKLQSGKPFAITGTVFKAVKGTGSVLISPSTNPLDPLAVTQTIADAPSWSETDITVAAAALPTGAGPGDFVSLFVANSDGSLSEPYSVQIARPILRLNKPLKDTDTGALVTQAGMEVMIHDGTPGSRSMVNLTGVGATSGVVEITNAAYTLSELGETRIVLLRQSDTRMGTGLATVVDKNDG